MSKPKSIYTEWREFFLETVKCDEVEVENLELRAKDFARNMVCVVMHYGTVESVLWSGTTPCGTEDRTWVRSYLLPQPKGIYRYCEES